MHIAQVAPPWFPIPPDGYGGIERVVHDLTEGMVAEGWEVTLFAPPGSLTSARLIPNALRPVGLDMGEPQKKRLLNQASKDAYQAALKLGVDLIHDHTDYIAPADFPIPVVRTLHGPATLDAVRLARSMSRRGDHLVAISRRQMELFQERARDLWGPGNHLNFIGVAPNPIDVASAPFYNSEEKEDYAVFIGRCHWEKGPDMAIRIARAAGLPLKMGMRVTTEERPYFEAVVKPLLDSPKYNAEFVGEVSGKAKDDLIGRARVLIFSSPWDEPFGLVLTEAGARGTPVIALARGSAPEVIVDGVTGILCEDEDEMVSAVPIAAAMNPAACRSHIMKIFDRPAIVRTYMELYERAAASRIAPSTTITQVVRAGTPNSVAAAAN